MGDLKEAKFSHLYSEVFPPPESSCASKDDVLKVLARDPVKFEEHKDEVLRKLEGKPLLLGNPESKRSSRKAKKPIKSLSNVLRQQERRSQDKKAIVGLKYEQMLPLHRLWEGYMKDLLVKKYHPDTNKDPEAKTKFIEIQNAYEILSDPKRKAMFDHYGATEEHTSGAGPTSTSSGAGWGSGTAGFDPAEIFKNIFTGGGTGGGGFGSGGFDIFGNGSSHPDMDVTVNINLSFLEAAKGAVKTISFQRLEPCSPCGGKGVAKGSRMATCKTCRGTGQETRARGSFYFSSTCRACGGMGQINPDPCGVCSGLGSVRKTATVQIEIPSGISEGEALSIRREGNRVGGSIGDVIVSFTVERSDIFTRKKNDIYVTVPIPLYQALLGGTVLVPTIDGNVELKVAPGTQPDDVKRMSGRGIYNATTREQGSQYLRFKIEVPRSLSKEQQELIERCFGPSGGPQSRPTDTDDAGKDSSSEGSTRHQWFDRLRRWLK